VEDAARIEPQHRGANVGFERYFAAGQSRRVELDWE
jgi:hypothetical protein